MGYHDTSKWGWEQDSKKVGLYIVSNCQDGYIQSFLEYYKLDNIFLDYECYGKTGKIKEDIGIMCIKMKY